MKPKQLFDPKDLKEVVHQVQCIDPDFTKCQVGIKNFLILKDKEYGVGEYIELIYHNTDTDSKEKRHPVCGRITYKENIDYLEDPGTKISLLLNNQIKLEKETHVLFIQYEGQPTIKDHTLIFERRVTFSDKATIAKTPEVIPIKRGRGRPKKVQS